MNYNNYQVNQESETGLDILKSKLHNRMVLFYANWCGHCQDFLPKWELMCTKVSKEHPNLDVKLVKVDCEYIRGKEQEKLGFNPEISGYPTVRVYKKNSNESEDYNGSRDPNDLIDYLKTRFKETSSQQVEQNNTPMETEVLSPQLNENNKPKKKKSTKKGKKNKDKKKDGSMKKGKKKKGSKKKKKSKRGQN